MKRKVFSVLLFLSISSGVFADEWVSLNFDSNRLQLKGDLSSKQSSGKSKASIRAIENIPFMKVKWLDNNDKVIKLKNMPDPRAFWSPLDEHGKHSGVFLKTDGDFMLKKPSNSKAVIIEFLGDAENYQVSHKLQFN